MKVIIAVCQRYGFNKPQMYADVQSFTTLRYSAASSHDVKIHCVCETTLMKLRHRTLEAVKLQIGSYLKAVGTGRADLILIDAYLFSVI